MFFVSSIMYNQASEVKSYKICAALKKKKHAHHLLIEPVVYRM